LPVPLSPVMSTVAGFGATFSAMATTERIAWERPTTNGLLPRAATSSRSQASSRAARSCSSDLETRAESSPGEKSLVR
jgi:hypothetical protein